MTELGVGVLGEIAVIVVGVLIALAVDHWRQSRNDRKNERRLLQGLVADLAHDVDGLSQFLEEISADIIASERVLQVVRGQKVLEPSTFARDLIRAANGSEPVYSLATYTELSNGNFHLVTNEALKRRVIEYYSGLLTGQRVNAPTTPQAWYDTGIEPYFSSLFEILPPGNWISWFGGAPADIEVDEVTRKLREAENIDNYLESALRARALQLDKFGDHQSRAEDLRQEVAGEIGSK
jgi:hypothetical protein